MRRIVFLLLPSLAACVVDRRGEMSACPVHGRDLEEDTVRILYGLRDVDEERRSAALRGFPHEATGVEGGCVVGPCDPGWARVRCCRACRAAGKAWDARRTR